MITALRYVLIKIFLSKTETRWLEAHDRHCPSPVKELITTSRYVLIKIVLCQRRKLDDSKDMIGIAYSMIRKHMIGIAFHQWKNWSPLYEMCWWRFSFLKDGNLIWSTWSALPFANERTDHHITISADQDFPFSKNGNSMIWSTWSALPFTNETTDHRFTVCANQDFPFSKTETRWFEAHDRHCHSPAIELITTLHFVLIDIVLSQRRKLDDLKAHDRHCHSPAIELITTLRFVLINIFLSQRRKLDDLKHMIGIAFHQWKNWSPLYEMCWSRFSFLKDGNFMIWSTWSALPSTNERTDHHFTICADQDFPFSKTETRWFEAHDRHCLSPVRELVAVFPICADQDFPFSKTETRWFERHDRHCLSPMKELITVLRYVLIKILLSQRRKLDNLKHMVGIAFHQWKNWSPLYDMCWSRFSVLKDGNSMIWSTWSALPFTSERTDRHFTTCADQDFPFSKTETLWFEAHDRHCLSPVKELIDTLRYVLIKIFFS